MDIKPEEDMDVIGGTSQLAASRGGIVTCQRRFDNMHARDSEITKRLCTECGDIIAGGEDKYQDHTLLHEAVYLAYQVLHAERRSGPPVSKSETPPQQPPPPPQPTAQAPTQHTQHISSSTSSAPSSAAATPTKEKAPSSKVMEAEEPSSSPGCPVDSSFSRPDDTLPQLLENELASTKSSEADSSVNANDNNAKETTE